MGQSEYCWVLTTMVAVCVHAVKTDYGAVDLYCCR